MPKHNAFNQAFNRLTPATLEKINEAVIQAAVDDGLEDGKKLRADTTVVETDIKCGAPHLISNADLIFMLSQPRTTSEYSITGGLSLRIKTMI